MFTFTVHFTNFTGTFNGIKWAHFDGGGGGANKKQTK